MSARGLPRVVVVLGVVSLLTDVASEMVYPLLPSLVASLGAGGMVLGAIEGFGDTTSSLLKLATGRLADRPARRRPLVLFGYALSALARPLFALAWLPAHVVFVRVLDRVGKGVRSSPRDAVLAASVPKAEAGRAFGFHRAMDNAGALLGPLLALAIQAAGGSVHTVIVLSVVPSLFAVATLALALPKQEEPAPKDVAPPSSAPAPRALATYLAILFLFTVANTSDLFLYRRLHELGVGPTGVVLASALLNGVRAVSGYPGGAFADRIGRANAMTLGWLVYAGAYLLMSRAVGPEIFFAGLVTYGLFYGLTEGAERAIVADLADRSVLGTAFGRFHLVTGVTLLPSNLAFGWAWDRFGGPTCLGASACLSAFAAALLFGWARRVRR